MKYIKEIDKFNYKLKEQTSIDEALLTRVIGGLTGVALGKAVGKFFIKAFNLQPQSALYKIFNSKLVWGAIGASFGKDTKKENQSPK